MGERGGSCVYEGTVGRILVMDDGIVDSCFLATSVSTFQLCFCAIVLLR